ncbi:DUF4252 domain-containing protein [Cellulophaga baltica]|jgi:hypothetical protein|uniref:DUF4252 domain-containing protein n=1 Tax=Cellulophaga baltica 18 TaxID=1348584 RepID=A0AAU8RKC7_9FLAO|nr:DUF4252 domain-containing protein [Cellulophaga baltica]AIZ43282.1 hypothetical protein M666_18035 [Cellulophaga baltica 18]MCR1026506.1 DUF4252 domain-containing protein [Cellulophaga baltica]WFO16265.1 DUF4252 domain-containing protein [Cellulophaga baltica 4]
MKNVKFSLVIAWVLLFFSCSSTQSLQEYYVDNAENPNFLSFDLPASLLNIDQVELTPEQKKAYASLKKLNVLAFKKTLDNAASYVTEKAKVKAILKNDKYQELMKLNTSYGKGSIKFLGDDDAIDEVIIYGDTDDKGFVLVRVLGDNMNPANLMQLIKAMEKSNFDGKQLEGLLDVFN